METIIIETHQSSLRAITRARKHGVDSNELVWIVGGDLLDFVMYIILFYVTVKSGAWGILRIYRAECQETEAMNHGNASSRNKRQGTPATFKG